MDSSYEKKELPPEAAGGSVNAPKTGNANLEPRALHVISLVDGADLTPT